MGDVISALQTTPVPTILAVGGIAFLFLAVVGQLSGQITVSRERQIMAAVIGALLMFFGVALYVIPSPPPISTPPTATADAATNTPMPKASSTDQPVPTPTHTPTSTKKPSSTPSPLVKGELLFEDNFDDNRNSWILVNEDQFWISGGFYHASLSKGEYFTRYAEHYSEELRDFVYEAAFHEIERNGNYSLLFRAHHPGQHWYQRAYSFEVSPKQQFYNLERMDFTNSETGKDWPAALAVRRYVPSLDWEATTHTLTVIARENQFTLYIDGQFIDTLEDKEDLYQKGTIGFGAGNAHIAVDYVRVWALP